MVFIIPHLFLVYYISRMRGGNSQIIQKIPQIGKPFPGFSEEGLSEKVQFYALIRCSKESPLLLSDMIF